jgi:hypothetical protein
MSFEKWVAAKDPNGVEDFGFNWSAWLGTDTISASVWIVPAGITKESDTFTTTSTTIWLSSGTSGTSYQITNRITTAGGRTEDRTGVLKVKDR